MNTSTHKHTLQLYLSLWHVSMFVRCLEPRKTSRKYSTEITSYNFSTPTQDHTHTHDTSTHYLSQQTHTHTHTLSLTITLSPLHSLFHTLSITQTHTTYNISFSFYRAVREKSHKTSSDFKLKYKFLAKTSQNKTQTNLNDLDSLLTTNQRKKKII